jgi:hypothetical protein
MFLHLFLIYLVPVTIWWGVNFINSFEKNKLLSVDLGLSQTSHSVSRVFHFLLFHHGFHKHPVCTSIYKEKHIFLSTKKKSKIKFPEFPSFTFSTVKPSLRIKKKVHSGCTSTCREELISALKIRGLVWSSQRYFS